MKSRHAADTALEALAPVCGEIRAYLDNKRLQICAEISNYPPPIPACDADFNHLLEERARLGAEIGRLDALHAEGLARGSYADLLDEFVSSSPYIDGEARQRIRSSLKKAQATYD